MSTSSVEIALQFYRAFDNRNIEQALALLAPNFVAHMAGLPEPCDRETFKQFGLQFYHAFPDGKHEFVQVVTEANKIVTCGSFTGTHQGKLQGMPPTGKPVTFSIMHLDRIENGKIIEHWGQGDLFSLMQQLGIISLPGPALIASILKNALTNRFPTRHLT